MGNKASKSEWGPDPAYDPEGERAFEREMKKYARKQMQGITCREVVEGRTGKDYGKLCAEWNVKTNGEWPRDGSFDPAKLRTVRMKVKEKGGCCGCCKSTEKPTEYLDMWERVAQDIVGEKDRLKMEGLLRKVSEEKAKAQQATRSLAMLRKEKEVTEAESKKHEKKEELLVYPALPTAPVYPALPTAPPAQHEQQQPSMLQPPLPPITDPPAYKPREEEGAGGGEAGPRTGKQWTQMRDGSPKERKKKRTKWDSSEESSDPEEEDSDDKTGLKRSQRLAREDKADKKGQYPLIQMPKPRTGGMVLVQQNRDLARPLHLLKHRQSIICDAIKEALVALGTEHSILKGQGYTAPDGLWGKIVTECGEVNTFKRRRHYYCCWRRRPTETGDPDDDLDLSPSRSPLSPSSNSKEAHPAEACCLPDTKSDSEETLSVTSMHHTEVPLQVYCIKHNPISVDKAVELLRHVNKQKVSTLPPTNPKSGEVYMYMYQGEREMQNWRADHIRWNIRGTKTLWHPLGQVKILYFLVRSEGKLFRKRSYELVNKPYFLIQYTGDEEAYIPKTHGNSEESQRPFVQTAPSIMKMIKSEKDLPPSQVYHELINRPLQSKPHLDTHFPRDMSQVQNTVKRARLDSMLDHHDVCATYILCEYLKDFVQDMCVYPQVSVVAVLPEMIAEFRHMMANTEHPHVPHVIHYDTTFNLGNFYVSPLLYRHASFTECPVIPLAFLLHQNRTEKTHSAFFSELANILPELNSHQFVICTDRETAIDNAITRTLPKFYRVNCWNHLLRNVRYQIQKLSGQKDDEEVYVENIRHILQSQTEKEWNYNLKWYSMIWSLAFEEYFRVNLEADVKRSATFALRNLGLMLSEITENASESFNNTLKQMVEWKEVLLEKMVFSLFHLQIYYVNEIMRGQCNVGSFHLKDPSIAVTPDQLLFPDNVLSLEQIVGLYKKSSTQEQNIKALESEMSTRQSMAELIINQNKITLDPKCKSFTVTGWRGQKYMISLAPVENCSCNMAQECCHILAAQMALGFEQKKPQKISFQLKKLVRKVGRRRRSGLKGPTSEGTVLPAPDSQASQAIPRESQSSTATQYGGILEPDVPGHMSKVTELWSKKPNNTVVASLDNSAMSIIRHTDFLSLKPNNWLVGETIDFYLHLMKKEMDLENNVLVMDHFLTGAILEGRQDIQKKHLLKRVCLEKCGAIIGAWNLHHNHWVLVYLNVNTHTVVLLDPQKDNEMVESKVAADCFSNFFALRNERLKKQELCGKNWKPATVAHTLQKDSSSCGVFVMEMGKQLINHFPRVPSYIVIPGDIIQCRETMAMEILSGSVSLEEACQWCGRFPDTDWDGDWILCDGCERWQHRVCVGMKKEQFKNIAHVMWHCTACEEESVIKQQRTSGSEPKIPTTRS
ncbi:uncharacterized protein [Paramormyrops kingsleyae]|uniref:uncharacterized protein isoform X2 n=1 Tax=Paramormyrops kingsleyae TaxID=1676925 RepID=UPI003B97CBA0